MLSWLSIKAKLWALGAALLAVAGFLLRLAMVKRQRDQWKHKAKEAKADAKWRKDLEERNNEIDQVHSERVKRAEQDVQAGKVPEHLGNPRHR